jgi:hypothetical protein
MEGPHPDCEVTALVLQGGGALGSYRVRRPDPGGHSAELGLS